jgi:hypothetical protein
MHDITLKLIGPCGCYGQQCKVYETADGALFCAVYVNPKLVAPLTLF